MWAWGSLSATKLQSLAAAAVKDQCPCPSLQKLARLGASGLQAGNAQRDLLEYLKRLGLPAHPVAVAQPVPLQLGKRPGAEMVQLPYMPLHRLLAHMHEHWPAEWEAAVTGGNDAAREWWMCIDKSSDPRWAAWRSALQQRALERGVPLRDMLAKTIPLALHADGVKVFRRKSLMVLSAVSLLGKGNTKDTKMFMHSYWTQLQCKGDTASEDTEKTLWEAAKWDLEACFEGTHPAKDYKGNAWPQGSVEASLAGKPWAEGYCTVPWLCKGDLDQFAKVWQLENYNSNRPCPWCKANRSTMPWTDFKADALWKTTCWNSDAEWRNAHPQRHPMFNTLCIGIHSAVVDGPSHTMALGVAQHCVANTLMQLVYEAMPDCLGTVVQKLDAVWGIVQHHYAETNAGARFNRLDLAMFCNAKSPHAHYPVLQSKAKEAEHLSRAVTHAWLQYANVQNPVHVSVTHVMQSLCAMFDACNEPGVQLSAEAKQRLMLNADTLLAHYTALANKAAAEGQWRWNVVPKFHMLWHWSRQSCNVHPKCTGTYSDEDFVGIVKGIAAACTAGVAIAKLPWTILAKYTQGMQLRWRCHSVSALGG